MPAFPSVIDLSNLPDTVGRRITGAAAGDNLGISVSNAGDINGDGFDDFIVGARDNDVDGNNAGAAYVIFGHAGGIGALDLSAPLADGDGFRIFGEAPNDYAGRSVSGLGDVNGDGYDDLFVGAPFNSAGAHYGGAGYVIFGHAGSFGDLTLSTPLTADEGFRILGDTSGGAGDRIAYSASSAGDINGDGFDDFVFSSDQRTTDGRNYPGNAIVIFGHQGDFSEIDLGAPLDPATGFQITGAADVAGVVPSSAGDFNGDGYDDLILGSPNESDGGAYAGAAYVIFGKASGFGPIDLATPLAPSDGFRIVGAAGDQAGSAVSSAGDINGDGFDDILIGAPFNSENGNFAGITYVLFGHATGFGEIDLATPLTADQGFRIIGGEVGEEAGASVTAAGDVNGDGFADIIVGAPRSNTGGYYAGAAYVIFGKAGGFGDIHLDAPLNGQDGFKLIGENNFDEAAVRDGVSAAGDVNGDGYDDILVGAYRNGAGYSGTGAAYVIYGHSTLPINGEPAGTDATVTINEDTPRTLTQADFGFSDPVDGNGFAGIVVTTGATHGSLTLNGVTVTDGTFVSVDEIDAGHLVFLPASDANGSAYASFTFQVRDDGGTANGGIDTDQSPNTITFDVTPVNDNPSIANLDGDVVTFVENDPVAYPDAGASSTNQLAVPGPGDGFVSDIDSQDFAGGSLSVSISAGAVTPEDRITFVGFNTQTANAISFGGGNIFYGSVQFGTSGGSATARVYSFNANATAQMVTALLHQIVYIDNSDTPNTGDRTIQYVLTDGDGGSTTAHSTIHVSAVDDAPVNHVPGAQGVNEDASLVFTGGNAITVTDVDAGTGTVTTSLSVLHGTLTLGSTNNVSVTNNGTGTVQVTGTTTDVNAALSGLGYAPDANYNGADTLTVTTSDNGNVGTGGPQQDVDVIAINVAAVNDAPSGADHIVTDIQDSNYVFQLSDFGFSDPVDGNAFNAVRAISFPAHGTLFLDVDGPGGSAPVDISSVGSGVFVGANDIAAGHLYFTPEAGATGNAYASFTFEVQDDGGIANGGVDLDPTPNTITIDLLPSNYAPVVDLNTGTAGNNDTNIYQEGGSASGLGTAIAVSDSDNDQIAGATVTITDAQAGDQLVVTLPLPGGIIVQSNVGGVLVLSGSASASDYQDALGQIGYQSTSDDPTAGGHTSRTIDVTVNDGQVDSAPAVMTITVFAVDDPAVAHDDAVATDEAHIVTGNVLSDNGSGADSDVDGPLSVSAVNGSAVAVGSQITLGSGAHLTLSADGAFSYDPNHVFDATPTAGSGASNTPATDSFTYTLTGGSTATVTVTLAGLDSNDTLVGTAGDDVLIGGLGADTLVGGAGTDTASYADNFGAVFVNLRDGAGFGNAAQGDSYSGIEHVVGSSFGDFLIGDDGVNRLDGSGGNDTLIGGLGADVLVGGAGADTVSYEDNWGAVFVNLHDGAGFGNAAQGDTYSGIENATGSQYRDVLIGDDRANVLDGSGGNDILIGGLGADVLVGGAGTDTASYEDNQGAVFVNLALGIGHGNAAEGDSYSGIENVIGTQFGDFLIGDGGANQLDGSGGNDTLIGGLGADVLIGGAGNDTVSYEDNWGAVYIDLAHNAGHGNAAEGDTYSGIENVNGSTFADLLVGDGNANILDGKGGNDQLIGGAGADSFAFTTALGSGNVDEIVDFLQGTDKIALDHGVFSGLGVGALSGGAFVTGTAAQDADDRIIYDATTGKLWFDADGNGAGAAVLVAMVDGHPILSASDFTVI